MIQTESSPLEGKKTKISLKIDPGKDFIIFLSVLLPDALPFRSPTKQTYFYWSITFTLTNSTGEYSSWRITFTLTNSTDKYFSLH